MQKRVDTAPTEPLPTDCSDKTACAVGDTVAHLRRDLGSSKDARHRLVLVDPAAVADCCPQRRHLRQRIDEDNSHAAPQRVGGAPDGAFSALRWSGSAPLRSRARWYQNDARSGSPRTPCTPARLRNAGSKVTA